MILFLLIIWSVTMLSVFWWCVCEYLGKAAATLLTLLLVAVIILALNAWVSEPTEQELTIFTEKRKGVGY